MKYDLWRFTSVLVISALSGFIIGYPATLTFIALIAFIFWQYRQFYKLLHRLKKRQSINRPSQPGIADEICREVNYLKDRHRARKLKLSGFLERFQKATGALPDAIIILGNYGEIEWANARANEYMGIRWPQDSGLRISNLLRDPKLIRYFRLEHEEQLARGLQINSPIDNDIILEGRLFAYGQTQKLLIARDITSISRNNQMRKDFIANASHELRTPLTVISGYLEGFVDDELCPKEWLLYLQKMRDQSNRMQILITDLLKLSSLEARTRDDFKETVVVPDLLGSIVNEARTMTSYNDHNISVDVDPVLYIKGNQQQLYSAFSNLLFNAVQYTPEKGNIHVKWYEDDTGAHLCITDDGSGIAAEHIPRLTERFYRIDKGRSREKGGTGLGLAIVKHVLAKYGGKLHMESEFGKGSLFRCDLPKSNIRRVEP